MHRFARFFGAVSLAAVVAVIGVACGGGGGSSSSGFKGVPLTGAGATFPGPIYEKWFKDFVSVESGAKINYQAIGSGGGVQQYTAGTVDFGASDAPLKEEEGQAIKAQGRDVIEIPTVLGGVVIAYNANGLQSGLKLDGTTAANIFLGKIKAWNDPAIAALNAGVSLPAVPIQVVHRSDESGTTKVFTSWLSKESPEWESKVGADKAVQWPVGTGGDGNDGVAAGISQTDGSIGYLSFDFAVNSGLGVASIKRDSDGQFVAPSVESISAAGGILKFPITSDTNILNSTAPGAYPISTTTYLLINPAPQNQDKGQTLVDFLFWALHQGQQQVTSLNYSPLPQDIQTQGVALLDGIKFNGQTITPSPAVQG
jgi:phosphate transport system substrate-binding protein